MFAACIYYHNRCEMEIPPLFLKGERFLHFYLIGAVSHDALNLV